jgi:DNA-damage-inducible protein D
MDKAIIQIQEDLESIKRTSNDKDSMEFWHARDLMLVLGYTTWAKFQEAIKRAQEACKISGQEITHHFAASGKMVLTGSGAQRRIEDFLPS